MRCNRYQRLAASEIPKEFIDGDPGDVKRI
jgi:hypothetical protein